MKIKFCGNRLGQDITYCNQLQPDYVGMILSPGFRRSITMEQAAAITRYRAPYLQMVGVFVNETTETICKYIENVPLDIIQLHGKETHAQIVALRNACSLPVWKAVHIRTPDDVRRAEQLEADCLIIEGYTPNQAGGTGVVANWKMLAERPPQQPWFLAGGLKPDNVADALQILHPDGVDFSSGTETYGKKDFHKMESIVRTVRGESPWKK